MQRALTRLPRHLSRRIAQHTPASRSTPAAASLSTSAPQRSSAPPFGSGPSPPRLPKEEQELFEALQKQSTGAFSTPRSPPTPTTPSSGTTVSSTSPFDVRARINQSPDASSPSSQQPAAAAGEDGVEIRIDNGAKIRDGEEFHPNMRRGAPPEFEGDVNPKTGEVGGPKNEPLRWGSAGDYSYNGRVTDF